ncbi:MAG: hypothetical protein K2R93_17875 [Gemmatimonadaceae bacterium]|nr:hypothetical protein [Gemmatimonadaceae bacterium]
MRAPASIILRCRWCHAVGVVAISLLGTACTTSTGTNEASQLGRSVPFLVGSSYEPYPGGALRVSLLSVDNDSRCPASVQCVSSGTATITLGVQMGLGPTVPTPVSLGANNTVTTGSLRATFDSLLPYPATPGPMPPQTAYRAWLTFRALPPD